MMRCLIACLWRLGVAMGLVLAACPPLFAQAEEPPATKEAWVISYFLVVVSIGLGLFAVCRPSRRSKKATE